MAYKNTKGLLLILAGGCILGGLIISMISGLHGGIFWVLCVGIIFFFLSVVPFARNEKFAKEIREKIIKVRKVVCDGPANYLKDKKTIVGWLFLSEDALEFYSSRYHNSADKSLPILLDEIEGIEVQNKQLIIYTKTEKYTFAVYKPKLWEKSITEIL